MNQVTRRFFYIIGLSYISQCFHLQTIRRRDTVTPVIRAQGTLDLHTMVRVTMALDMQAREPAVHPAQDLRGKLL